MKKNLPKISIITPSFNQAEYILQTVESVLNQGYPNLEYLIIDGGSTDGTLDVLKKYSRKIHLISEKDNGQSDAINKGLKMSTGQIVSYLNSDDVLEDGALLKISEFFMRNPQIWWVTGKCFIIDENGDKIRRLIGWYKNMFLHFFRSAGALLFTNYISQPATFWRKEIMDKVGLFDESLHYSMDYDYWIKMSKNYELGFIDGYLASFRIHKESKTSKKLSSQLAENHAIVKKYSPSKLMVNIHRLHDKIMYFLYNVLSA